MNRKTKIAYMYEQAEYRDSLYENPVLQQLAIELTLSCNCRCLHCGSDCGSIMQSNELTDDEIITMLHDLKKDLLVAGKKLPFVFVTGGEPMLRKNMTDLMYSVHNLGYEWGMTTNAMLITEAMAKLLKNAGMYSVGVSLDGLEETHDWFRQTSGSYKKALDGVQNLSNVGIEKILITTVVHKKNIEELDELYNVVRLSGCDSWRVVNLEPIGRALSHSELMLEPSDYKYLIEFIKAHDSDKFHVYFGCNHFVGYENEYEVRPWFYMCQSGLRVMSVQSNGDITGCLDIGRLNEEGKNPVIQGNVRESRLYDVWMNKFEMFRRRKAIDSEKCRSCKHLYECDGGGWHTWDIEKNNPLLCMVEMLK